MERATPGARWWQLVVFLWWCSRVVVAGGGTCYPPGGVAGIVVATIIVTLVVAGLGAAVAWRYWWTPRQKEKSDGHVRRPEAHQQQQKKNSSDFAFDNPYFRNSQEADEQDGGTTGRSKPFLNNKNSLRSSKLSEASAKAKKARGGKNHFGFGGGKKKAQDDSCIASVEPERAFVSLRGHDFTGLGFNICGNMRDGILVKDVLHRGPASESGLIKAGDKIVNVTVSFTNIVYEDALTILSYASPYDVQLEIERIPASSSSASSSGAPPKRLGSCSFNNSGQKLFHPLYRSQSIDDLTQIDGGGGSNAGGGTFPTQGGPRRSQSVGVAAHFRRREQQQQGEGAKEDGGGHSSSIVLTGSLNEKMLANVMTDSRGMLQWEKRFEDTLDNEQESSTPRGEGSSQKPSAKAHLDYPPTNLKLETKSESPRNNVGDVRSAGKTAVEVSGHQTRTTSEVTSRRGRDEENDSDVSRDSLEVSHRAFAKRNANKGSALAGRSTDRPPAKAATERVHLGDRSTERSHSNSLSSNEEITVVQESYSRFDSVDQNCTQQPSSKPLNVFSGPYGERQKQPDGTQDGYSGSKITVNGGPADDHSGKGGRSGHSQRGPLEEDRPQSKFAKKAAPAGGMFTQINPFQVSSSSSKLQQRGARGPWASAGTREQIHVEQTEFQGRRENIGYSGPKLSLKESSIKHRQF